MAGENGEDKKVDEEGADNKGSGNSKDSEEKEELKCYKEEREEKPSAFEEELKKLDPVNGVEIINNIKENTKIDENVEVERSAPQVTYKTIKRKIKVDLSLEKNFNPDEYIHILSNYMENDNHLADRYSETFGKFEIEDNFPLHIKRLVFINKLYLDCFYKKK